ncbi:glycoside hydrolase family 43 protein [Sphingomonas sp.]|uniref:glycoside hydrolase family 43 protein n=1 Tax=Sphingomonas sp. TaxID=28214 RepID=UPI00286DEAFD|nr:glycoside hydrolase family 43 protein [Sphingomonas sp.]
MTVTVRSSAPLILAALLSLSAAAPAEPLFTPAYTHNFPDAFVLEHDGVFLAYATNDGINLPMLTSRDLVTWAPVGDPANPGKRLDGMPALAPWVKEGFTWAPEVMRIGNRWLLYYTANHRKKDVQCIGVAVADAPTGPFRDSSPEPMVCQFNEGGSIDANPFRDADGKLYLYWKSDGNRVGKGTWIWGQPLSADGLTVTGAPVGLIRDDQKWENKLVEAPTMVRSPTGYAMFFSAAYYGWNADERLSPYAMGYATCQGPLGPCVDAPNNPILFSFRDKELGCLSGPGHQSIFQAKGQNYVTFHAWAATSSCRKAADARYLYVAPLYWKDGKPEIGLSVRPAAPSRPK